MTFEQTTFVADEIDSAFLEMGVTAPITRDEARLILAIESASRALDGRSNVFDEAAGAEVEERGGAKAASGSLRRA